jgi:PilZ domain-containing protein
MAVAGTGTTREVSSNGLSFRCRRPLPVGSHIELTIDWPARYNQEKSMELVVTGIVARSDGGRTAVRLTSKRFHIDSMPAEGYRATA